MIKHQWELMRGATTVNMMISSAGNPATASLTSISQLTHILLSMGQLSTAAGKHRKGKSGPRTNPNGKLKGEMVESPDQRVGTGKDGHDREDG